MKVALNLFAISKIGGILTCHKNVKLGLQRLGHKVEDYFITLNKEILPENTPCSKALGFMNDTMLREYQREMSDKDLIIFTHPCPTKTKAFDSRRWQECYKTGKPNLVLMHDPFIDKYYPWFLEVKDLVKGVGCIQQKALMFSQSHFPNIMITGHFMDIDDAGAYRDLKEDLVISPHQFKRWKHIEKFIRAIPYMGKVVKKEVYNGGIEQAFMAGSMEKRKSEYRNPDGTWIWDNAINAGMEYKGHVSDEEIKMAYKRSKAVVDMSVGEMGDTFLKKGIPYRSLNYSVIEAMKYGSIPIVRASSLLSPSVYHEDVVLVGEENIEKDLAANVINVVINYDNFKDMIDRNIGLVRTYFDCVRNVQKFLELLK